MLFLLHHIELNIFSFSIFDSKSQQAEEINKLTTYFFIAAAFILLTVTVLTVYVIVRFRLRDQDDGTTKDMNPKWEIPMIGIPFLLVGIFLFYTIRTMKRVLPPVNGKAADVVITGHQWWWEAEYPSGVRTANEIHLPVGKKLLVKLLSADVIHDWWVPQFGNKMDMIPSRENYLWLTIKEPGTYRGACSEFCGAQHAGMAIQVIAEEPDAFNKWMNSQRAQSAIADTLAMSGRQFFLQASCSNCHAIAGTTARGRAGPDLTHIGSRKTLLTGLLANNEKNLEAWIRDPRSIKPGANMPKFLLDEHTVKAIATYLSSLK